LRNLITISICLFVSIQSVGQTYFNNTYESGQLEGGVGLTLVDDTLYTLSWQYDFLKYSLILTKLDLEGNRIAEYPMSDSVDMVPSYIGFFKEDDHFVGYGYTKVLDTIRPLIFKFSKTGQIIWQRSYNLPGAIQADLNNGILGNGDSTYVFGGLIVTAGNGSEYLFFKTDTAGNELTSQVYGGLGHDQAISIDKGLDSGYILSGYNKSVETNGNLFILKLTESGNTQWSRNYGTNFEFESGSVTTGTNNYWVVGPWGVGSEFTGQIMRLNKLGNIDYQIIVNDPDIHQANLYAGVELTDGSFIAVGVVADTVDFNPLGWMLKVDSNCNEIWKRTYQIRTEDHYLRDVISLGDTSFVACGYVFPDGTGNSEDMWLIRTDSFGCDSLGCHTVGINDIETKQDWLFKTYPNPSSGTFTVYFEASNLFTKLTIQDLLGNVVLVKKLYSKEHVLIDLSDQPAGIYLCSLQIGFKTIYADKLILTK
jgi:hypothetical protein